MAVFTAIATAITTAIGSIGSIALVTATGALTTAGVIATGLISTGLMLATAKVTGVFDAPSAGGVRDPGVKVQLPPATDNKIPVFYGRNNTGSIITDAEIKNQNNTMVYMCIIGEKTDSGTYTLNKVYRGDSTLNFTGGYSGTSSPNVISITDPNATTSNNVNGKMRLRVYAGNAQTASNQIFPPLGLKVAAQTLMPTITANTNYEDLVYAVFEIDYDPENGLTDFGVLTFDITNSLSEPSNVLLDYLQNDRYGAGLSSTDLVTTSFDDLYDYSTAQVDYITPANVTTTHDRWQIDGMLSTYQPVKSNIDKLCQSCSAFFTYDPKQGKFRVQPNRAATTAEKSAAFQFNDDNIIGKIGVSTTELYSLYNSIEAEYPEVNKKDQTNVVIVDTPAGDRNANEPDNPLNTRYDLVNDYSRVYNLANIDLRQSRTSMVLEFEADYSAIQVDVGDVVKVTNSRYAFTDKLFRVMRTTEIEDADGTLKCKLLLLEYSDDVYTHNTVSSQGETNATGIPGWWTSIGNSNINIGNIVIIDDPNDANANIVDDGGNIIGNVDWGNIDWPTFPGFIPPNNPFINLPINFDSNVLLDEIVVDVTPVVDANSTNTANTVANTIITIPAPFDPTLGIPMFPTDGTVFNVGIPTNGFGSTKYNSPDYTGIIINDIYGKNSQTGATTQHASTGTLPLNPGGFISPTDQGDLAPGTQIEDRPPNNTSVANAAVTANTALGEANSLITSVFNYDITGIDQGEFSIIASTQAGGVNFGAGFDVAFAPVGNIFYTERYEANNEPTGAFIEQALNDGTSGVVGGGLTAPLGTLVATQKVEISDQAARDIANNTINTAGLYYTPLSANVQLAGNSTIQDDTANGSPRAFFNNKFDIIRLTKGDNFF